MTLLQPVAASVLPLAKALTPVERFEALRDFGGTSPEIVAALGVVIGLVSFTIAGYLVWRRSADQSRAKKEFDRQAAALGLSTLEGRVLERVARAAGIRRVDSIFTMAAAFETAVQTLLSDGTLAALAAAEDADTAVVVQTLREKMGFEPHRSLRRPMADVLGSIAEASSVFVVRSRAPGNFQATFLRRGETLLDFALEPETPLHVLPDEVWSVRTAVEGILWEFAAGVTRIESPRVLLRVLSDARYINRRRFPRVPTQRPALLAEIALLHKDDALEGPEFTTATVVEIGGPGLLLRSTLDPPLRSRVLIIAQLGDDEVLQAIGTVLRVTPERGAIRRVAVELLALSPAEVSRLVRETNLLAQTHRLQASPEPEPTSPAGVP